MKSLTLDCEKDPLCLHTRGHDLSPCTCDLIHLLQLSSQKSRTKLPKQLPSSSPSSRWNLFPTNKKRVWVYLVICNRPRFCPSKTGFPSRMGNGFGDLRYGREKTKIFTSSQQKENLFILFYLQPSIGSCLNIVSKVRNLIDAGGMRLQICKRWNLFFCFEVFKVPQLS